MGAVIDSIEGREGVVYFPQIPIAIAPENPLVKEVMGVFRSALSIIAGEEASVLSLEMLLGQIAEAGGEYAIKEGIFATTFLQRITERSLTRMSLGNTIDRPQNFRRIIAIAKAVSVLHDVGKRVVFGPRGLWTERFRFLYAQIHALMGKLFLEQAFEGSYSGKIKIILNTIAKGVESHHEDAELDMKEESIAFNLVRAADVIGAMAVTIIGRIKNVSFGGRGYVTERIKQDVANLPDCEKGILQPLLDSENYQENLVGIFFVMIFTEIASNRLAPYETAVVATNLFPNFDCLLRRELTPDEIGRNPDFLSGAQEIMRQSLKQLMEKKNAERKENDRIHIFLERFFAEDGGPPDLSGAISPTFACEAANDDNYYANDDNYATAA